MNFAWLLIRSHPESRVIAMQQHQKLKPKDKKPPRHRPEAATQSPLLTKADAKNGASADFINGYR